MGGAARGGGEPAAPCSPSCPGKPGWSTAEAPRSVCGRNPCRILPGEHSCLFCWPLGICLALCAGLSSLAFVSGFLFPLSPASLRLHPDFSSIFSPFSSAASWILEKGRLRPMGTRTSPGHIAKKAGVRSGQRHRRGECRSICKEMQESKLPAGTGRAFRCLGPGSENIDQVLGAAKEKVRVESAPRTLCPEPEIYPTCPAAGPRRLPHSETRLGPQLAKLGR